MENTFTQDTAPEIKSIHGSAKIYKVDSANTIIDPYTKQLGQYVEYIVNGDPWNDHHAYLGVWNKTFIDSLIKAKG